jgi:hypothetical protein
MNKTLELTSLNKDIIRIIGKYLLSYEIKSLYLDELKLATRSIKYCLDKSKYYNIFYFKHYKHCNNRKFKYFSENGIWIIV